MVKNKLTYYSLFISTEFLIAIYYNSIKYKGADIMVDYITGVNGTGKTRLLVQTAIATADISKGSVVFVDCESRQELHLPNKIRLINTADYEINSAVTLIGFLLGLCASNFDLTDIFIDSAHKILKKDTDLSDFMEIIAKASENTGVNFHFSIGDSEEKRLIYQNVSK